MASKFNGLARGTYQCHPRQMMTNKPLNVDDEDVVDDMPRIAKPLSQPTSMSYFLLRIRLNEIARNLVDRTPFICATTGGPSLDVVMDIDTQMQQLHNDIPSFFALPPAEISKTYNIEYAKALTIARQGSDFDALFHSQRCRLHLPFARRGYTEPEYAPSRDLCIQSARLIIRNETAYYKSGLGEGGCRYVPLFYSMTVFFACTVLLMDYSYTQSSLQREKQKVEICDAVRLLEMVRSESELAAHFMDTMVAALQKHGITPVGKSPTQQPRPTPPLYDASPSHPDIAVSMAPPASELQHTSYAGTMADTALTSLSVLGSNTIAAQELDSSFMTVNNGSSDLNELVRSLDHGVDVDTIDWDDIFVGLGPTFR
ncbi:hypothetical protein DM02DRAFT_609983 [Periconia macrospinosa]|uniref:Transcription factor domain-containing protein n=1 Tax=Periconia macrospinosa TaxID=97972 RepID=A0A2V1EAM6_9PLEO|nr:hypothetical protein DM02DRAFT_609983 [Periconia macrospinosa]